MPSRHPGSAALMRFAHELADASGQAIARHFRTTLAIANKADGDAYDPVTTADRAAERVIRRLLKARFPEHGLVGEEYGTILGRGPYRWFIDPIDGTRSFITGSPLWGTLIGLMQDERPLLGLMNQPFTGERVWSDGRRSRWRGPRGRTATLSTRACAGLSAAVLATTHPDIFAAQEASAFAAIKSRARMTRYGGDCYGYCLLAAGFIDLIIEAGLRPWDIVALVPIIESAGGIVTTWDGRSALNGGRIIAAGDKRVHAQALALLRVLS